MQQMMIFLLLGFMVVTSEELQAEKFEFYQPNMLPLKKSSSAKRYFNLTKIKVNHYKQRYIYKERYTIVKNLVKANPSWLDGYWIFASEAFQLGSTYVDERDHPLALKIFAEGEDASRTCLNQQPENPLCKMFLGANMAAAATINGVVSSLRDSSQILELWQEVYTSKINYQFTPEVSLQGSVRYALGLFYRLVPNSRVLSWIFGVSGDIERSVELHKEVIAIDGKTPCGNLMLAAAMICQLDGDNQAQEFSYASQLLVEARSMDTPDMNQAICRMGSMHLANDKSLACGYTTAKQQDSGERHSQILQGQLDLKSR